MYCPNNFHPGSRSQQKTVYIYTHHSFVFLKKASAHSTQHYFVNHCHVVTCSQFYSEFCRCVVRSKISKVRRGREHLDQVHSCILNDMALRLERLKTTKDVDLVWFSLEKRLLLLLSNFCSPKCCDAQMAHQFQYVTRYTEKRHDRKTCIGRIYT